MLNYNPLHCLPSSEELPDSDDTAVDNELQNLIPGLLKTTSNFVVFAALMLISFLSRELYL
ncbi:hypothetical protein [uncultured Nostoc sp.]|uniref:hypothetical protein n=1 Tax=uncultured Nostoc sp. TaxID=340711 RepID=UPI0035C999EB